MKEASSQPAKVRVGIVIAVAVMTTLLFPSGYPASAQDAGNIEFLNPSSFAASDTGIVVSDQVPDNPEAGDETYRLSAWVSGIPQSPAVEFELLTRQGVSLEIIDDVQRVGADTFEADWDIPDTLPDGPYTIRATLASGILGVDHVDQPIMIQRLADRAEITYPDNRSGSGQFGMFVPLGTSAGADGTVVQPNPIGEVESRSTGSSGSGTARVRAFYTVSQPGTPPEWHACGTEAAGGSAIPSGAAYNGVRCTLSSTEHLTMVTGVAVVANNTKQGYEAALNQAGDATRVIEPYAQVPSRFEVVTGATGTVDPGTCHLVELELADQAGREILGANIDVHAWGPNDRLRFGTGQFDSWGSVNPDQGSHATEEGIHCLAPDDDRSGRGLQGEHQVIGGPDVKHIENATDGTDDTGQWGFQLYTPSGSTTAERHTTYWEVWLDEANTGSGVNNDSYDTNEMCRSGLVGWGSAATSDPMSGVTPSCPESPPDPCESSASQTDQPCPTTSPAPTTSPTPTTSPPPPPPEEEGSITIGTDRRRVKKGRKVRFSGTIDAGPECTAGRDVVLRSRRPNGNRFRRQKTTTTDSEGNWLIRTKPRRTKAWRVAAPPFADCDALRSGVVKVKVIRASRR